MAFFNFILIWENWIEMGFIVPRRCQLCGFFFEDSIHLFFDCFFSKEVWWCVVEKFENIVDWNWKSIISCLRLPCTSPSVLSLCMYSRGFRTHGMLLYLSTESMMPLPLTSILLVIFWRLALYYLDTLGTEYPSNIWEIPSHWVFLMVP